MGRTRDLHRNDPRRRRRNPVGCGWVRLLGADGRPERDPKAQKGSSQDQGCIPRTSRPCPRRPLLAMKSDEKPASREHSNHLSLDRHLRHACRTWPSPHAKSFLRDPWLPAKMASRRWWAERPSDHGSEMHRLNRIFPSQIQSERRLGKELVGI